MQFIFSTGSLYTYGLDRCFKLAQQAGFEGIEVMVDQRWDTRQVAYLQRLVDYYHLPIVAVHSPFIYYVPGWPDDDPGRIQQSVRLAETLGAQVVVHHLPPRPGWRWLWVGHGRIPLPALRQPLAAAYRRWLRESYQAFQAATKVTLCIENMPARSWLGRAWNGHQWNNPVEITRFPHLTLDTTHLGTFGLDPNQVYPQLRGKVGHIHLSNFDGREHRRPEDGHLALDRFLSLVARDGYQGVISLELQPDSLNAGESDEEVIRLMGESLDYCRGWVG